MSAPDASFQRAVAQLNATQSQIESLARQVELVRMSLEDAYRARETLQRAKEAPDGTETLLPVGANSFLYGSLKGADRVIVGIGNDVAVEMPIDTALARMEERTKTLEGAEESLAAKIAELEASAEEQNRAIQEMYARTRPGPPG